MAMDNNAKIGSDGVDRNPDAITGAPGSHPTGTGIGSASGAATGAALGAIGGPVGALIGGVAGAVTGAVIGHKAGEANDPTEDFSRPGDHADPAAAVTNPKPTAPVTTSGRPVDADDITPRGEVLLDDQKIGGTRSAVDNVTRNAVVGGPRTTEDAGTGSR